MHYNWLNFFLSCALHVGDAGPS